jgi:RNA polymerase sigma-70 factor (ECF subfamily)
MPPDFRAFYDAHVRFVWRALLRLGVVESELPDLVQEVFVVVHRKMGEFEGRAKVTTWLFAICMRVASDARRRARARREAVSTDGSLPAIACAGDGDAALDRQRARRLLDGILDRMPDEQRVVFALFELEGLSGDAIAELLDLPVGTVRSRLRLAREAFDRAVARLRAVESTAVHLALKPVEA